MKKRCSNPLCKKIIIEDWEKWLEENENTVYLQCPYCFELERIKWE